MSNVGVFVDLALAAVLLIALVMGWRQGFVQALTRILVVVAALLLAGWIAGKLAEPAAKWLEPVLTEKLEQRLTAQGNTSDAGEMLAAFGFEGDTLSKLVDSAVQKAQQAVEEKTFSASVGGGVVSAEVNGKKEVTNITIKPEAVDPEDVEMLQDLIISAVNEALRQAEEAMDGKMNALTSGLGLSGFGF